MYLSIHPAPIIQPGTRHQTANGQRAHVGILLVIGRLEEFSEKVKTGLDDLDWLDRRELIRTLVKQQFPAS